MYVKQSTLQTMLKIKEIKEKDNKPLTLTEINQITYVTA